MTFHEISIGLFLIIIFQLFIIKLKSYSTKIFPIHFPHRNFTRWVFSYFFSMMDKA